MTNSSTPPDIEERFLEPEGWQWGHFENNDRHLRFGFLLPDNPTATVVILPGRTEFVEKHFETTRDLLKRNMAVWILDWHGQAKSGRLLPDYSERDYSRGFENHVADLHTFITEYVQKDSSETPLIMMAQSMGANIGLRYLHKHPGIFKTAILSTPMFGIKDLGVLPFWLSMPLLKLLNTIMGHSYAFGQHDWVAQERESEDLALSGDPVRAKVHDSWLSADPSLRLGGVTFGWLYHALASCRAIQSPQFTQSIETPCLIALAGKENLVDNNAIRKLAQNLPNATLLELPESGHEILMEADNVRNSFFEAFDEFVKKALS